MVLKSCKVRDGYSVLERLSLRLHVVSSSFLKSFRVQSDVELWLSKKLQDDAEFEAIEFEVVQSSK